MGGERGERDGMCERDIGREREMVRERERERWRESENERRVGVSLKETTGPFVVHTSLGILVFFLNTLSTLVFVFRE